MNIRPATDSDLEGIKSVVFGVLSEYGLDADPDDTDADLDSVERNYLDNGGFFGIVEKNGLIVATVGIFRVDSDTCELRKMYVLSSQRGKGLGKTLMEFALTKARELGFKRMILETASPLIEAIGLYRRYGFRNFEPEHLSSRCDQAMEIEL